MIAKELAWEACAGWIRERQRERRRVVFTNGCFDLLHAGHIHYLHEARCLGDYLVVGVNSDASVRRLKGPQRPVMSLDDRLLILGALEMVDVLVVFPVEPSRTDDLDPDLQDTPYALLRQLHPDVLVKGADYSQQAVVGREFAGEVRIIPLLEGRSTSALLDRIHQGLPGKSPILE
ncbi:MAG: adenylyltransferase/cytidyltransferase family protein [Candidatus Neomarinimicrobiota bacterium]